MKRKLISLLCALLLTFGALAESPVPPMPSPEISTSIQAGGSMSAKLNDSSLTLEFDPDPQFSVCRDGYVQASFFAYGEGDLLYELYVTFPQDVSAGQTVTPESCLMSADLFSGIYLYISDNTSDLCSAATQYLTGPYPAGSSYSLTFDSVSADGALTTFAGMLTASLVEVDANYAPTGKVNDFSGSFSFTMDLNGKPSLPDESRAEPASTPPPADEAPIIPKDEHDNTPDQPAPTPDNAHQQRPPTPPAKLIPPANARKI